MRDDVADIARIARWCNFIEKQKQHVFMCTRCDAGLTSYAMRQPQFTLKHNIA